MRRKEEYHLENPTWCRGCGLYGIFDALKRAAASLDMDPEQTVIVTGIGCHGRMNNYFKAYGVHGLHGRTLPLAAGVKLCNPGLRVIGVSGDGDAYAIGQGHFIHAVRRNMGLVYLVVNNRIYGLTEGQISPTSEMGFVSISTPYGSKEYPLDGPTLALAAGGTFIARGFSGETAHLAKLIQSAMRHQGFALIDILSPCVTHNKAKTYGWYRENIYFLDEESSFDPSSQVEAWRTLRESKKIPVGLIYQEQRPTFEDLVLPDKNKPIAHADLKAEVSGLEKIMEKFG
ncbi:MAG: 2-oxoacid:ferredoxin oxidoreductase subunit beta [Candidatus Aminicenantales bacterium]